MKRCSNCEYVQGPDRYEITPKHKYKYRHITFVCKFCGWEGHSFIWTSMYGDEQIKFWTKNVNDVIKNRKFEKFFGLEEGRDYDAERNSINRQKGFTC
jgi:rubredoxin